MAGTSWVRQPCRVWLDHWIATHLITQDLVLSQCRDSLSADFIVVERYLRVYDVFGTVAQHVSNMTQYWMYLSFALVT
jgi:hypothetical protein